VKTLAKNYDALTLDMLAPLVSACMPFVKDPGVRLRLAAERALVHLLKVGGNAEPRLQRVLSSLDTPIAKKNMQDYYTRVLSKISPLSDDED